MTFVLPLQPEAGHSLLHRSEQVQLMAKRIAMQAMPERSTQMFNPTTLIFWPEVLHRTAVFLYPVTLARKLYRTAVIKRDVT